MVKILIITGIYPPEIGGPASYAELLMDELPKNGIEPQVLTYGTGSLRGVHYVSRGWPKGLRHFIFFLSVIRYGRRADIILSADSSFGAAYISAWGAKLLKKKFVVRITGDYAWEQGTQRFGVKDSMDEFSTAGQKKRYGFFMGLLRKCQAFSASEAAMVIAPSEYLKKIVGNWGISQEKIKVIYNSVELPAVSISKTESRKQLGLSGLVVVSAGRFVPWKGFDTLIDVIADLQTDFKDLNLVIIGDGPEMQKLKAKSEKRKANVLFTGALSKAELLHYLRAADIFALNTGYEGLSHQIIEAMHLGIPVVTTNVGGNPEVIIHDQNGVLVPYNNKDAFVSSLRALLKDADRRNAMGKSAQESKKIFSKEYMISELVSAIKSI